MSRAPAWTPAQRETLERMVSESRSNAEIAAAVGRSVGAVALQKCKLRKRTGIDYNADKRLQVMLKRPIKPLIKQLRVQAMQRNIPVEDLAERAGVCPWAIYNWGKTDPSLSLFEAAAEAAGLKLVLVPMEDVAA